MQLLLVVMNTAKVGQPVAQPPLRVGAAKMEALIRMSLSATSIHLLRDICSKADHFWRRVRAYA